MTKCLGLNQKVSYLYNAALRSQTNTTGIQLSAIISCCWLDVFALYG